MDQIKGGCLCGDVRLKAQGRPDRVGICHCFECRKHHGALFYAAAIFHESRVSIEGETHQFRGRHSAQNAAHPFSPVQAMKSKFTWGPWMRSTDSNPVTSAFPSGVNPGCPTFPRRLVLTAIACWKIPKRNEVAIVPFLAFLPSRARKVGQFLAHEVAFFHGKRLLPEW